MSKRNCIRGSHARIFYQMISFIIWLFPQRWVRVTHKVKSTNQSVNCLLWVVKRSMPKNALPEFCQKILIGTSQVDPTELGVIFSAPKRKDKFLSPKFQSNFGGFNLNYGRFLLFCITYLYATPCEKTNLCHQNWCYLRHIWEV